MIAPKTSEKELLISETSLRRGRQLMYLIYFQAIFLALAYIVGVWLATIVHNASITLPEVIIHVIVSSGFATLTGVVGFLAVLQGQKQVGRANLVLFFITVLAGASGFAFLGDTSNTNQITLTNLSMMGTIGIGMPVTGFSLAKLSRIVRSADQDDDRSPTSTMIYLALGALSLTLIAGAGVHTAELYATAVVVHFGLAALTVSLVLGVLVLSAMEGASKGVSSSSQLGLQRVGFSLLSLTAISLAAGVGVVTIYSGGVSYVVVMAEVAAFVYAFLILATIAPFHLNLQFWRRPSKRTQ